MDSKKFIEWCGKIEDNKILLSVRNGMLLATPAIIAGSFALLFLSLPFQGYQDWLSIFMGGFFRGFFTTVKAVTLDIVSLIMILTISYSYEKQYNFHYKGILPFLNVCAFLAFSADAQNGVSFAMFQSIYLFNAFAVTMISSIIYRQLSIFAYQNMGRYIDTSDSVFNITVVSIVPAIFIISIFSLLNAMLVHVFGIDNFQNIFSAKLLELFQHLGRSFFSGLLFIFLLHFMWIFGIHGGNMLDGVARQVFILDGGSGGEIWSKTFFDTFVLFGGCGALTCMVIAMLIADKRRAMRNLSKMAAVPVLFNMNELLLFGIPIVFNPIYFIPFLLTPLVLTSISYLAIRFGIVPAVLSEVEWTTPILISGYAACGSLRGSLLQLVNLMVGTAIYIPFVNISQRYQKRMGRKKIEEMVQVVKDCEKAGTKPVLINRQDSLSQAAKSLSWDLKYAIEQGKLQLYYQPQISADGRVIGAEALLRWIHESGGLVYPPLVIALAEESGLINALGDMIIQKSFDHVATAEDKIITPVKFSVNLTAEQAEDKRVLDEIAEGLRRRNIQKHTLGIEITEQAALSLSDETTERLSALRRDGIYIIMDDFGMGHSSLMYLQNNQFDVVKLDGSLVKDIAVNKRSREIISSIMHLARTLDFQVIAECVETEEQRRLLEEMGCVIYQGYLYSPAVPFEDFVDYIKKFDGNRVSCS